jgi:transposase-like protein
MRKGQHFARSFKRAVAVEYLQSGEERKVIAMKYGLPNVQTISNWVSLYLTPHEIETKCVNLPRINVNAVEMAKVDTPQPQVPLENQQAVIEQLQRQLQKLEKQLQFEKDRNYALNTLIDIAEEQGIKIRKKSGVKR